MDPVSITIVSALSWTASLIAKEVAPQAVKDAYNGLKNLILGRIGGARPDLEAMEREPDSAAQRDKLARQIQSAASDEEIKRIATQLLDALDKLKDEPKARALIDFKKLRAARNFEISDISLAGPLLVADEATFEGDFSIKGVRQTPSDSDPRKN